MGFLNEGRRIIREMLAEYARGPSACGEIRTGAALDAAADRDRPIGVGRGGARGRARGGPARVDLIERHIGYAVA